MGGALPVEEVSGISGDRLFDPVVQLMQPYMDDPSVRVGTYQMADLLNP